MAQDRDRIGGNEPSVSTYEKIQKCTDVRDR
jgi:hypothetical protein